MRHPKPSRRPDRFRLNTGSPLYRGLVFAGLGQHAGGLLYYDESAGKGHGTLTGFAGAGNTPADRWQWDGTLRRQALGLNGSGDYVIVPHAPALDALGALTCCAWGYYATGLSYPTLLSKATTGNGPNFYIDQGTGKLTLHQGYFSGNLYAQAVPALTDGALSHFAVTADGTGLAANVRFYQNGAALATLAVGDGTGSAKTTAATDLWVGRHHDGAYYWKNPVADALLWNLAQPAGVVAALADPSNVDLRLAGVPLVLPVRRYWPVAPASGAGALLRRLIGLGAD